MFVAKEIYYNVAYTVECDFCYEFHAERWTWMKSFGFKVTFFTVTVFLCRIAILKLYLESKT